jgi:predicted nuclease of predicted toxin-antitoxin system
MSLSPLRLVIDMNLPPEWVAELLRSGYESLHWSTIGDPRATDTAIMAWARANHHAVFTHDLDFGTLLALTHADGPSVFQVRGQNVLPEHMGSLVIAALRQHEASLISGALLVVDQKKSRVRVLPL